MTQFLARQKFRFDLGQGVLSMIQFCFIVLAASDKIATLVHLPARIIVPIVVPVALLCVWYLGKKLDDAGFQSAYQSELNRRNEMLNEIRNNQ